MMPRSSSPSSLRVVVALMTVLRSSRPRALRVGVLLSVIAAGLAFGCVLVRFPSPQLTLDAQPVPAALLWWAAICGATGVVLVTVSLAGSVWHGRRPTRSGGTTTNVISLVAFTVPLALVSIVAHGTVGSWSPAMFAIMIWSVLGIVAHLRR